MSRKKKKEWEKKKKNKIENEKGKRTFFRFLLVVCINAFYLMQKVIEGLGRRIFYWPSGTEVASLARCL